MNNQDIQSTFLSMAGKWVRAQNRSDRNLSDLADFQRINRVTLKEACRWLGMVCKWCGEPFEPVRFRDGRKWLVTTACSDCEMKVIADIRPTDSWIGKCKTGEFRKGTHNLDKFKHVFPNCTKKWKQHSP